MSTEEAPARKPSRRGSRGSGKKKETLEQEKARLLAGLSPEARAEFEKLEQERAAKAIKGAIAEREKMLKKTTGPGSKWTRKP